MPIASIVDRSKPVSRVPVVMLLLACTSLLFSANQAPAQTHISKAAETEPASALVMAFVGGFVHSDDLRHPEVRLAQRLQAASGDGVQVRVFKNRERGKAHKTIVEWLNGFKTSTETGKKRPVPRIILFGHSWGASAVVYLARELERDGIPVSLTILVDSVRRSGEDDSVIPANVAEAVNFYQSKGIIHGRSKIMAADPARTAVLGNFRFEYEKVPAECHAYPWYARLFLKGHLSIECDPRVWSLVETLIEDRLAARLQSEQPEVAAPPVD
ncbi:MAG TPA: hypothetical protein VEK33_07145 [Terriglobales bacterium]|nr:hypothetical protein [Terriglobales bacterium]